MPDQMGSPWAGMWCTKGVTIRAFAKIVAEMILVVPDQAGPSRELVRRKRKSRKSIGQSEAEPDGRLRERPRGRCGLLDRPSSSEAAKRQVRRHRCNPQNLEQNRKVRIGRRLNTMNPVSTRNVSTAEGMLD